LRDGDDGCSKEANRSLKSGGSKTKNITGTDRWKSMSKKYSKEEAAGAESLADVQGTGPVKQ
jgi:hypothetical protein